MNHKLFRKLFFDAIYSIIDLFIKQPDDVNSSKNNQVSEYQGKDALELMNNYKQSDDVISSKYYQASENQGKNALKNSTKNQVS